MNPNPNFREVIKQIARAKGSEVTVFADFCRMVACCLAAGSREEEYLEIAGRYEKGDLDKIAKGLRALIDEMEAHPFQDVLGPYYLDIASKSSKDLRGEFYTPPCISGMMARMLFDPKKIIEENRATSLLEPASGAGGMVLATAELLAPSHVDLLRVTCWDISPLACDMCYINLTLWGIPTTVIHGDTLRNEITSAWKNIHWVRVGEDARLALKQLFRPPQETAPIPKNEANLEEAAREQLGFDF